jgi:hypothetical protein
MIEGALITGGIYLSYWLDFGFSFLEPSEISWRFPIAFLIIFGLVIIAFSLELPESPRWLVMKGKEDEALSVLSALDDRGSNDPVIHAEFSEIKNTVLEMSKGSFRDLFTTGKLVNLFLPRAATNSEIQTPKATAIFIELFSSTSAKCFNRSLVSI